MHKIKKIPLMGTNTNSDEIFSSQCLQSGVAEWHLLRFKRTEAVEAD